MSQKITCPKCKYQFDLDEVQKEQFEKKEKEFQDKLKDQEEKIKNEYRKKALKWAQDQADEKTKREVAKELEKEKKKQELEFLDLKNQIKEKEEQAKKLQNQELELRKKARELEDKTKQQELENQRKIDEEKRKLEDRFKQSQAKEIEERLKKIEEENVLKLQEKEKQMDIMKKTIEDLKRKSDQGSMQIQGEVQENGLKDILKEAFPFDLIEDVPTGIKGGDIIQTIKNRLGQKVGVILWESKNTKSWSDAWLKKLKADQERVKADVCIIISKILPDSVNGFDFIKNVWVGEFKFVLPLAGSIRMQLEEIQKIKKSLEGRDQKMNQLSSYLSGNQFKNRIENMVLSFIGMKDELEKEKRAMGRIWARRDKEIENVLGNMSGMYGDLQAIMGNSLPEVESLELPEGQENN